MTVKGPKGTITREFKHINLDMQHLKAERKIRVDLWFGNRKQLACIRTICSHIENMVTGVRIGFLYKMKFVYSHFPINVTIAGDEIEIRNFMGEKRVRKIRLMSGVTAIRTKDVKDQLEISGIDITKVSLAGKLINYLFKKLYCILFPFVSPSSAAQVQQMTNIRNKDIRKFLDGNIHLPSERYQLNPIIFNSSTYLILKVCT